MLTLDITFHRKDFMNNLFKVRLKVLEKLFNVGYNTDDKISKLKIEELLKFQEFTRSDLEIVYGLKEAYQSKSIITFLSGINERRDK